ncbi:MAG: hypothetical protein NC935_07105 [Candidatus Omnitrophica bacterium]|nr:hypothetical protein [Candidatus Omnitrophota bacterium]
MPISPYVVRIATFPYTWEDPSISLSTGWGLTTELAKTLPIIWDFFAKTKPSLQTWVMPDSGMGYANVIPMPSQNLNSWLKETAFYQRKFQYRTGWILEGFNWQQVPSSSKVADYGKKVSPEGIFYNALPNGTRIINNGLPIVPMIDFSWAGDNIQTQANNLKVITNDMNSYQKKFLVLRNVFVSDKHLEEIISESRKLGADFEVVNPSTFFYLYQLSFNQYPYHRLSVISHNIPSVMKKGKIYSVKMKVRNDGWAIWSPSGTPVFSGGGDYKLAYGYQLKNEFSPTGKQVAVTFPYNSRANITKTVMPGEEIEINFNLNAPNEEGEYFFQFDGVKEYFEFFETNGNIPWLKEVYVVSFKKFLSSYLNFNQPIIDLNFDDKINSLDFLVFMNKN